MCRGHIQIFHWLDRIPWEDLFFSEVEALSILSQAEDKDFGKLSATTTHSPLAHLDHHRAWDSTTAHCLSPESWGSSHSSG